MTISLRQPGPITSAVPTPAPPGVRRGRRSVGVHRRALWLFVLPAAVPYVIVVIVPAIQGVAFSFTDWNGLDPDWSFIGLDNYAQFFQDATALSATGNTLLYALVTMVVENVLGLLLALALNSRIKSRNVLRVVFFLPVVIITIVVAYLWSYLYLPAGPINEALQNVGLGALAQNWLGDPNTALGSVMVISIWQFSGYAMVIYLAGLQSVPTEQLEAAALDGAGPLMRFWFVIRPFLVPAIVVNLMLSLIRGLMVFDQIWVTTAGGPASSTNSLSTLVYLNAFQYGELGYGAAIAVVLTVFVAAIGVIQYRALLRQRGAQ